MIVGKNAINIVRGSSPFAHRTVLGGRCVFNFLNPYSVKFETSTIYSLFLAGATVIVMYAARELNLEKFVGLYSTAFISPHGIKVLSRYKPFCSTTAIVFPKINLLQTDKRTKGNITAAIIGKDSVIIFQRRCHEFKIEIFCFSHSKMNIIGIIGGNVAR